MGFGFGHGKFGAEAFGEFPWSLYQLYTLLPTLHKQEDEEEANEALRDFMEALRPLYDDIRRKIRGFGDLRDPLRVRSSFDDNERLRLGPRIVVQGEVEQRGIQGSVSLVGNFVAPRGRFRDRDIGKELTVGGSVVSANNRTVVISSIVSLGEVVTVPPLTFNAADTALRWDLRAPPDTTEDQVTVEVQAGDVAKITPGWSITDGFGQFEVAARRQFNIPTADRKVLTEQEGRDGAIDSLGRFSSATVVLDQRDVGKKLTLAESSIPDNVGEFFIERLVDVGGSVVAELSETPGTAVVLDTDVGPLEWAILPRPELDLVGTNPPLGTVEQSGFDGEIDPDAVLDTDVFRADSLELSAGDVGKFLFLRGTDNATNDGPFRIEAVLSPRRAQLAATFTVPEANNGSVYWELRPATFLGDLTQVDAKPPSLLRFLAQDFGIELDLQESEARQRSWVRNVAQWLPLKGTKKAYEIIAKISGFDADVSQLYRVSQNLAEGPIPSECLTEIGDSNPGRVGVDGSLTLGAGRVRFSSPTAEFRASDVGRQIRIRDSSSGNDGLRTIDRFIDEQTVEFRLVDTATVPDVNNGFLSWNIVRLYTDLAPELPLFDEINTDLLEEIVSRTFLPYDAQGSDWTVGEIVTGSTSGSQGKVVSDQDDGSSGVLRLAGVTADFIDNEPLTGNQGGAATADLSGPPLAVFSADRFCWEEDFLAEVSVEVLSVSPLFPDPDIFEVVVEGPANVVLDFDHWRLIDKNGDEFFVDTVPEAEILFDNQTQVFTAGQRVFAPKRLDYDGFAGPGFTAGNVVTGSTSQATAVIADDDNSGATGTLLLTRIDGFFIDNEPLVEGLNTANADGFLQEGASATISEVTQTTPTTGTLKLANLFGTFEDNELLYSITDEDGNGKPDAGTVIGLARAASDIRFRFTTRVAVAPAASDLGLCDSLLRYVCPVQILCNYCPSHVALADVTETTIASESGEAIERALERVFRRFREVTPAHVLLAQRFSRTIDISLSLSMCLDDWISAQNLLIMFVQGVFDYPGVLTEDVPLDQVLRLTVEATPNHISEMNFESECSGNVVLPFPEMADAYALWRGQNIDGSSNSTLSEGAGITLWKNTSVGAASKGTAMDLGTAVGSYGANPALLRNAPAPHGSHEVANGGGIKSGAFTAISGNRTIILIMRQPNVAPITTEYWFIADNNDKRLPSTLPFGGAGLDRRIRSLPSNQAITDTVETIDQWNLVVIHQLSSSPFGRMIVNGRSDERGLVVPTNMTDISFFSRIAGGNSGLADIMAGAVVNGVVPYDQDLVDWALTELGEATGGSFPVT